MRCEQALRHSTLTQSLEELLRQRRSSAHNTPWAIRSCNLSLAISNCTLEPSDTRLMHHPRAWPPRACNSRQRQHPAASFGRSSAFSVFAESVEIASGFWHHNSLATLLRIMWTDTASGRNTSIRNRESFNDNDSHYKRKVVQLSFF